MPPFKFRDAKFENVRVICKLETDLNMSPISWTLILEKWVVKREISLYPEIKLKTSNMMHI